MDLFDLIGWQKHWLSNLFNVKLITRGNARRYRHVIISADSAFKLKFCVGLKWTQITADKATLSLCVRGGNAWLSPFGIFAQQLCWRSGRLTAATIQNWRMFNKIPLIFSNNAWFCARQKLCFAGQMGRKQQDERMLESMWCGLTSDLQSQSCSRSSSDTG